MPTAKPPVHASAKAKPKTPSPAGKPAPGSESPKRDTRSLAARKANALATTATKATSAAQARAEALLKEIARRKERIAEDFYDIGVALAQIAKNKLHLALGHKSFDEMLKARNVLNPSTARSLIQLVGSMTRDEALAYGQEKAIALLGYARATPEIDTPKTLMAAGQLPDGKPVAKASVRDLKQAAKKVRTAEGKSKPASAEAKNAEIEAKAVARWLRERGAGKAEISASRRKEGYVIRVELKVEAWARLRTA